MGHLAENCDEKHVAGNLPARTSGGEFKLKGRLAIGKQLLDLRRVEYRGNRLVVNCESIGMNRSKNCYLRRSGPPSSPPDAYKRRSSDLELSL